MEIILSIAYAFLFSWLIFKLPFFDCRGLSRKVISGIFILKILGGIGLTLIYTYYYTDRSTADIFKYFDDSAIMFRALREQPLDYLRMLVGFRNDNDYFNQNYYHHMNHWFRQFESNIYNDSHTIIRFNAFVRLFSFGHFTVHTVFICFLSLIGLTAIYKAFSEKLKNKDKLLAAGIFLLPSVLFWGSGVLKEGLLLFGLGILIWQFFRICEGRFSYYGLALGLFATGLLLVLKFYILIALFPGFLAYVWVSKGNGKHVPVKYLIVLFCCTVIGLNLHLIFPEYHILEILAHKQGDFIRLIAEEASGSGFQLTLLQPDLISFITVMPEALINSFLRPFLWESAKPMIFVAALENTAILLLGLLSIIFMRKWAVIDKNLLFFILSYVIILYLLIGWITPVTGAIVRYKVPGMLFLVIGFLMVIDKEKILSLLRKD